MINTPFNYTGSKFKLLPQLLPNFDYSKSNFFDVFAGGGSVYTNVVNRYDNIYANDVIKDLVKIHKKIILEDSFIEAVKLLCVYKDDAEGYSKLRESYNNEPTPEKLYALMLCCTNNMMRFSKSFKFNQTFGKRTFNPNTQKKIDEWKQHICQYIDKLTFLSYNYVDILPKMSCDLSDFMFYLDPPYYNTEAGYNAYWSKEHEKNLITFCREIDKNGGSFAISGILGEHKKGMENSFALEALKKSYSLIEFECDYDKVSRNKNSKNSVEVLIKNY